MKFDATPQPPAKGTPATRRGLIVGASVAAGAAVAAKLMPGSAASEVVAVATPKAAPDTSGGYQPTQHVLRYYETTRA
jgi:hypothetical protein